MTRIDLHGRYTVRVRDVSEMHKSPLFIVTITTDEKGEVNLYFTGSDTLCDFATAINAELLTIPATRRAEPVFDPFDDEPPSGQWQPGEEDEHRR